MKKKGKEEETKEKGKRGPQSSVKKEQMGEKEGSEGISGKKKQAKHKAEGRERREGKDDEQAPMIPAWLMGRGPRHPRCPGKL